MVSWIRGRKTNLTLADFLRHPLRHRGNLNQFAAHGPIVRLFRFDVRPNFVQFFKDDRVSFVRGFQGRMFGLRPLEFLPLEVLEVTHWV